jgi:DNA polymerase-3 subunit epsilon
VRFTASQRATWWVSRTGKSWPLPLVQKLNRLEVGVGHNLYDFDATFTIRELERINHELPDFEPFDTMIEGRWATPFGKAPSLKELCWACNVPYDPDQAHAALYDVRVMMLSFFYGLRRGVFKLSTTKT